MFTGPATCLINECFWCIVIEWVDNRLKLFFLWFKGICITDVSIKKKRKSRTIQSFEYKINPICHFGRRNRKTERQDNDTTTGGQMEQDSRCERWIENCVFKRTQQRSLLFHRLMGDDDDDDDDEYDDCDNGGDELMRNISMLYYMTLNYSLCSARIYVKVVRYKIYHYQGLWKPLRARTKLIFRAPMKDGLAKKFFKRNLKDWMSVSGWQGLDRKRSCVQSTGIVTTETKNYAT